MPNKNNKTTKVNRNKLKKKKRINTKFADKVFNSEKVNTDLIAKGYHTEGKLRGTINTSKGGDGGNNQMIDITT